MGKVPFVVKFYLFEPVHEILVLTMCGSREGSDEPCIPCTVPDRFFRGGPTLTGFLFFFT